MSGGSLLFFAIKIIVTCNGNLLWDPHNLDYDRLKQAADAAIDLEAKKQYDSSFNVIKVDGNVSSSVLFSYLNPRPWLPLWIPSDIEKVFPTVWNIQSSTSQFKSSKLQPNKLKFQSPWKFADFPKTDKPKIARKITTNQHGQYS